MIHRVIAALRDSARVHFRVFAAGFAFLLLSQIVGAQTFGRTDPTDGETTITVNRVDARHVTITSDACYTNDEKFPGMQIGVSYSADLKTWVDLPAISVNQTSGLITTPCTVAPHAVQYDSDGISFYYIQAGPFLVPETGIQRVPQP